LPKSKTSDIRLFERGYRLSVIALRITILIYTHCMRTHSWVRIIAFTPCLTHFNLKHILLRFRFSHYALLCSIKNIICHETAIRQNQKSNSMLFCFIDIYVPKLGLDHAWLVLIYFSLKEQIFKRYLLNNIVIYMHFLQVLPWAAFWVDICTRPTEALGRFKCFPTSRF